MKDRLILLVFTLLVTAFRAFSQEEVRLSSPQLELDGNVVAITYEILNSSRNELYYVWIEVTDTTGLDIAARNLSGDIGDHVKGGGKKRIEWDLKADSLFLDKGIYVQVFAEKKVAMESRAPQPDYDAPASYTNPFVALGQSLVLPGWGISRITGRKIHITKGYVGYGLLASSVILNRIAIQTYNDYLTTNDMSEVQKLYKQSLVLDDLSEISAYSAIVIWTFDLVWTYTVVSRNNKSFRKGRVSGLLLSPAYDPVWHSPVLGLYYTF